MVSVKRANKLNNMLLQILSYEYKYLATDAVRKLINKNGTGRVSTMLGSLVVVIDYEEWLPVIFTACTENGVAVMWGDDIDICVTTLANMIKNIIFFGNGREAE